MKSNWEILVSAIETEWDNKNYVALKSLHDLIEENMKMLYPLIFLK